MNELVREIEEDIQRERMERLWLRFGRLLIAAAIGVVIATIIIVVWKNHRLSIAAENTAQFTLGVDKLAAADYKGALAAFDPLTKDEHSGIYAPAMMRKGESQNLTGDKTAIETYKTLAADTHFDAGVFAELAQMLIASESATLLSPQKSMPLYASELEREAWQLVQQDKKQEAAKIFAVLRDDNAAPMSLRQRALEALSQLPMEKTAHAQ